jgi:hypothetical protein
MDSLIAAAARGLSPSLLAVAELAEVALRSLRTAPAQAAQAWTTPGRFVGTFGGLWILTALTAAWLNVLIGVVISWPH